MKDELSIRGLSTKTVSLADYRVLSDNLAEVVVAVTGTMPRVELAERISAALAGAAQPIAGTFHWLNDKSAAVGFVTRAHDTQIVASDDDLKQYRAVASNMYVNDADESVWELREGAGKRFLARRTEEELPEVLSAARQPRRTGIPTLSHVIRASVKSGEFVAFVTGNGESDYGVAIGKAKGSDDNVVLSMTSTKLVQVPQNLVISTVTVDSSKMKTPSIETAGMPDAQTVIDYWRRAYNYDQEYLNKLIDQVNETAAL